MGRASQFHCRHALPETANTDAFWIAWSETFGVIQIVAALVAGGY
jgi:hypothetical protein